MAIRDLLGGPDAASGSVAVPGLSELDAERRQAIPADAPRGIRNNNPGNIRKSAIAWQGEVPGTDPAFETFDSPENGIRALDMNLTSYQTKHGLNTPREIVSRWAPSSENNTEAYVAAVSQALGVEPDAPINVQDPATRTRLRDAIIQHENGQNPYSGRAAAPSTDVQGAPKRRSIRDLYSNEPAAPSQDATWGDWGSAAAITAGDFAKSGVGALENAAGRYGNAGDSPAQLMAQDAQSGLGSARRSITQWQKDFFDGLSPVAKQRLEQEYTTLDPSKTAWKGGPVEFLKTLAYKGTMSMGPTIGPMVTSAILQRIGVGAAMSTLYGAQEGLMSAGLTASQIADDIDQTPLDELRTVERFRVLEQQYGEQDARRKFIDEVQGWVPAVTGLLVGSIAKGVGTKLDKVFGVEDGLPIGGRFGAGFAVEAAQEGPQSYIEQVMQNYAQMAYDKNINLTDGAFEQAVQGMLLGGPMGGTFAAAFGSRPSSKETAPTSAPVADDIAQAIATSQKPTGPAAPGAGGGGAGPMGPLPPMGPSGDVTGEAQDFALPSSEGSLFTTPPQPWDPNAPAAPGPQPTQALTPVNELGIEQQPEQAIPTEVSPLDASLMRQPMSKWNPNARAKKPGDITLNDAAVPDEIAAALGQAQGEQPWDPNAQAPQPTQELLPPEQPHPGFDANRQRDPAFALRPQSDGIAASPELAAIGGPTKSAQLGYRVRVRGPDGELVSSRLVEGKATAKILAKNAEGKLQKGQWVEMVPARRTFMNDKPPTPEPVGDLVAQAADMRESDRKGVYLTRESMENLKAHGKLDEVLQAGVPIRNFDTYGGVLLAKDAATAQELMDMLDNDTGTIDEILGYATGAGNGKRGNTVVQKLDAQGNVIRERLVAPTEVQRTKMEFGGQDVRVMPLEQALAIRHNRVQKDAAELKVAAEAAALKQTEPAKVGEIYRSSPLTEPEAAAAEEVAAQGGLEEDIGGRLIKIAEDRRAEELDRRKLDKELPAPEDVAFRGKEVTEAKRAATHKQREAAALRDQAKAEKNKVRAGELLKQVEALESEANKARKSISGGSKGRSDLLNTYREMYGNLRDLALRTELAKTGVTTVQEIHELEIEYDRLKGELKDLLEIEGGYTKSAALMEAATRYSPKARKETIRALSAAKEAAREKQAEKEAGITGSMLTRDSRVLKVLANEEVSVPATARKISRIRRTLRTPEGKALAYQIGRMVSPTGFLELVKEYRATGATEAEQRQYETALIEAHQLLQQWVSDYRLALRFNTPRGADENTKKRNYLLAKDAAQIAEMYGNIRASNSPTITRDKAAIVVAERITRMVTHGKRWGVGTDMDIDGFWKSVGDPVKFRDYLRETVASRDDLPFPSELTHEYLKGLSIGMQNSLYARAVEFLGSERESDGVRRAMVAGIMEARGDEFSNDPETITETYIDINGVERTRSRTISPRAQFRELFSKSNVRGSNARMGMDQLKELYLKGGEVTIGKGARKKVVKIEPVADKLPVAIPLNLRSRKLSPADKRKIIMRAVGKQARRQYGGRSKGRGLARAPSSRYNTSVLTTSTRPRELVGEALALYEQQKSEANQNLNDALSNSDKFLVEMQKPEYADAVYGRAYFRWLHEYGNALRKARLQGREGFAEMNRVAEDLNKLASSKPEQFAEETMAAFKAEEKSQLFYAIKMDPVHLDVLKNPAFRAKSLADQHKALASNIARMERIEELWASDPDYQQVIGPVLKNIAKSVARDGWPSYLPTQAEKDAVKFVLAKWSGLKELRDSLSPQQQKMAAKYDKSDRAHDPQIMFDEFYVPVSETLRESGFFNRDTALLKQYASRFRDWEADGSPTAFTKRVPMVEGGAERLTFGGASEQASEQARIDKLREDKRLASMTDEEAEDLNPREQLRRTRVMNQYEFKALRYAAGATAINDAINDFRRVMDSPDARVQDIAQAEAKMLDALEAIGAWKWTSETSGMGTISLPQIQPILDQLRIEEKRLRNLERSEGRLQTNVNDEGLDTGLSREYAEKYPAVAERINELRAQIEALQGSAVAVEGAKSTSYRTVANRLRQRELTKEQARTIVAEKLKTFNLRSDAPKQVSKTAERVTEEARVRDMSPEGRRAYEAMKRRGELNFDLSTQQSDYGKASDVEYDTFFAMRDRLASTKEISLGELLTFMSGKLGADHKYQPLIRTLLKHAAHRRVPVAYAQDMQSGNSGKLVLIENSPVIKLNEDDFMTPGFNPLRAIHVVLHEAVHAATVRAMMDNQPATDALNMLRKLVQERLGDKHSYATGDVFEFVAEAYTNAEFQRALKAIKVSDVETSSLWGRFVKWVGNILGFSPQHNDMLDAVMSLHDHTFGPQPYNEATARKVRQYSDTPHEFNYFTDEFMKKHAAPFLNSLVGQNKAAEFMLSRATDLGNRGRLSGSNAMLGALSMRQIDQFYSAKFGGKDTALGKYMGAFFARNADASKSLELSDKLSREWTRFEELHDKSIHEMMSRLMTEATYLGIHPDAAFTPGVENTPNGHLKESQRDDYEALRAEWEALGTTTWSGIDGKTTWSGQTLYKAIRDYYRETVNTEVRLMLMNALRASKFGSAATGLAEGDINLDDFTKKEWLANRLGIDIKQADEDTVEELKLIARMANIPMRNAGPYFPLMRFGDFAVKAQRVVETKVFDTRAERSEYMAMKGAEDPTLQFNYPEQEDGKFPLTVSEVEFRLAETQAAAEKARAELIAEYGGQYVSPVQLKQSIINEGATIGSNRALQTLLGKLEGNAAAQAAIRQFYIKSLADRSFRKRETKRKNIRGVDPNIQHRTFGFYSKSASYYTSQLRYGHIMADGKAEMQNVVKNHRDETDVTAIRLGQVTREIETRDGQMVQLTEPSWFVRKAVESGQFWLLLSPSYWMINLSQPYMVTAPWLAGHTSLVHSVAALKDAQAMIMDPLVTQGIKSWGGLRALKSRMAAEEAFSVLDNVEASIRKNMTAKGQDPQPVLAMLTALKRESIIDLSFVAELRNIAAGEGKSSWDRVLDASRIMAHLTEVNNRIMTAIAAYSIAKTNGKNEADAIEFAKAAVAETQFDYSSSNKPRLFSGNDAWWKPLVFQFMQYVQHMYVMFARHIGMWWKAPKGSEEAKVGRRVVMGLMATHFAAAGLTGLAAQPVKWGLGLMLLLFGLGADDDDRTVKNWLSGDLHDRWMEEGVSSLVGNNKLSEVIRGGLPRAAGIDLSSRMAFLQAYMIDLNPKTAETLFGSLALSFGGPMFGLAGNAYEGMKLAMAGDADKAAEKFAPKLGRDVFRAFRLAQEGLVDSNGKTILAADKLNPMEIFLQGIGFAPSQIAEMYSRNSKVRDQKSYIEGEKARIMKAYRMAGSTGEIDTVMDDLREFNSKYPRERISVSDLLRSKRSMYKSERNLQRYGVDAGKSSYRYDDETYNVE